MAKNELTLLQEIIGQLRSLNKSSVRDRLRDAEEAKRLEKLSAVTEDSTAQQVGMMDAGTDFQRRYLAAQAGAITTQALQDAPVGVVQKVIAKSSDKIHSFVKQSYSVTKIMRYEQLQEWRKKRKEREDDIRGESEDQLEGKGRWYQQALAPLEEYLRNWALRRERWEESKALYKETWKAARWRIVFGTIAGIYLVMEGIHTKTLEVLKWWGRVLKTIGAWTYENTWQKLVNAVKNFRIKVFAAWGLNAKGEIIKETKVTNVWAKILERLAQVRTFGYKMVGLDATGKPAANETLFKDKGMWQTISKRLASIRTLGYRMVGLGPDGKALGWKWHEGPHGTKIFAKQNIMQTMKYSKIGNIVGRIGRFLKPLFDVGKAIVTFGTTDIGSKLTKSWESLKKLGGGKVGGLGKAILGFLRTILWPVTILFTLWEGFKAGKEEWNKEGSTWLTTIGETIGGMAGYFLGALVDLIKWGIIWLIKKAFGIKSDKDGRIIPGQGMGADILQILDDFKVQDLVHKLFAAPYHMLSNLIKFIWGMFTSADFRSDVWAWITNFPQNIANWIKGLIPDWHWSWGGKDYSLRKVLGVDVDPNASKIDIPGIDTFIPTGKAFNPLTNKPWTKKGIGIMQDLYGDDWQYSARAKADLDRAEATYEGSGAKLPFQMGNLQNYITVINYESRGYGSYVQGAASFATADGQTNYMTGGV